MRRYLLLVLIIVIGAWFFFFRETAQGPDTNIIESIFDTPENKVKIGDDIFFVEIADEDNERAQGLSGKIGLESDHGMLFVFDKPDLYAFWMKDMRFSIDILWIRDNKVVGVATGLEPDNTQNPKLYYPPVPVNAVLEIKDGELAKRNINIGDTIEILSAN